jgi:two-component system CheB/CheR fusion protein
MDIKDYISNSYPKVSPYEGINSVEGRLIEKEYLVVVEDGGYVGILTPMDLIKRPHKIVIDCLAPKEPILVDDSIITVFDKFQRNKCVVLPVFEGDGFIGVIEKNFLINRLKIKVTQLHDNLIISQKLKSSFLNSLSHEIRTPLNGILGFLELMSDLDVEGFKINGESHLDLIKKSADRFLFIMNDLVDLSLIHSGDEIKIKKEKVMIESLFSDLKDVFDGVTIVSNKEISLHYINPNTSMTICSDRNKIERILYHLIDNAIKFSTEGTVKYGYNLAGQSITFFVTNEGALSDEKGQIFDVFYKYSENKGYIEGLGIGLALAKEMTELLDGTIHYSSTETETTFNFTLPLN